MPRPDLLLRDALVHDGSGAPAFRGDVVVSNGCIERVGIAEAANAARVIDLDGLALAPGFIDVHTHDDRLLLADPAMTPKLSQGVTSVVTGNCGISLAPLGRHAAVPPLNLVADDGGARFDSFAAYFAALHAAPPAVNFAALVGHTSLRAATMPVLDRPARPDEIARMQALLREALDAGAIGLSTGTYYAPAAAATAEEIRAVAEPLRGRGAVIASHIRDEGEHVLEAMREAIAIAAALGVRQVLSHHKVLGRANFGRSRETLALLDEARLRSDVCLDCYPYVASSTVLRADAVRQALRTIVAWSGAQPATAGRDLDELAREQGLEIEALIDALQPAGAIYFSMDEKDVQRILGFERTMIGSDGLPHDDAPHPRLWGTFPRVLGHYSRDLGVFPLETAVHKMTGLTAKTFGLADRGVLKEGYAADITLFDAGRIGEASTFEKPIAPARGIDTVIVNGTTVWRDGKPTGARAGKVLRRASAERNA